MVNINIVLTGGTSQGSGGGQQGRTGGQHTGLGGGGGQGKHGGRLLGLQQGNSGTIGGTKSGIFGAGHCRNIGLQLQGGHGVQGTGGGQHGWQHGSGRGQEKVQGSVPQGKIAGHVGQ